MKKIVWLVLQFLLFLICNVAGSFIRPFHIQKVTAISPGITHIFVWDGFLVMLLVYVLIVVVEALTRRIRSALPMTTLALVIAIGLSVALKLGHITREL